MHFQTQTPKNDFMLGKTQCINQIAFVNCMAYISNKLKIVTPGKKTISNTVSEVLFTEAKMLKTIILILSFSH